MAEHHRRAVPAPSDSSTTNGSTAQHRHDQLLRVYRAARAHEQASRRSDNSNTIASHDLAVLQRHFEFIRDDEADLERGERDWQVRMSVRYYRKLFREYALADLSQYKEGKVGLRWRTEMEVVAGKGQFVCGNKICDVRHALHSYELLFAYMEHGEKKRCLVKVRVCESCARKLFYRKLKEADKEKKKQDKKKRRVRDLSDDEGSASSRRHKKLKRSRSDSSEEDGDLKKTGKVTETKRNDKSNNETIHARCAAINAADARGLDRTATDSSDKAIDDNRETQELARLLL